MVEEEEILYFTTSIEMVLKELRMEKGISQGKPTGLSQSDVNIDFANKYKVTLNMGRMESKPSFGVTKLFLLCDYFGISITQFFERVLSKKKRDIISFLESKKSKKKKKSKSD
jgi:transcriptional regulator with XRE-family HTH domain